MSGRVEVWQAGRVEPLGHVEQEEDVRDVLEARDRLELVESEGWFTTETRMFFDLLAHFRSIDDWLEHQEREGYTGAIPDEVRASADRLLSEGGELVIREPIRASRLRRLPVERRLRRTGLLR